MPYSKEEYESQKAALGDAMYPTVASLPHEAAAVDEDSLNRMVQELARMEEKRSTFSRRRAHNDDKDVDYINSRNKSFNEKISRTYDKYTVEIKQNLERGTAI